MTNLLAQSVMLPCGIELANRFAKAAMSEGLADAHNHSTEKLETLYLRWAGAGAGLLISGNIQVDRWHLERPANVVVDDASGRIALARLAAAGKSGGAQFWAQLSHTGRQVSSHINSAPLSPSNVEIDAIRSAGFTFAISKPMCESEIHKAIEQFAFSAKEVKNAGFTGISLHAAHGYLISQFLSPLSNRRTDRWGGSLAHRARFLLEVIAAVRKAVGSQYPVGIKLNSSDFQKGGFSHSECLQLAGWLNDADIDLLELSGGSLEQPKVIGVAVKDEGEDGVRTSSDAREAYFIALAGAIRKAAAMPVMVTGGFRKKKSMVDAIQNGELDIVGIGRPLIADPECLHRLQSGEIDQLPSPEANLNLFHILPWNNMQLIRLGDGLDPDLTMTGEQAARVFAEIEKENMTALLNQRSLSINAIRGVAW